MSLPGYDDWLDNYGDPGLPRDEPEDVLDEPASTQLSEQATYDYQGEIRSCPCCGGSTEKTWEQLVEAMRLRLADLGISADPETLLRGLMRDGA